MLNIMAHEPYTRRSNHGFWLEFECQYPAGEAAVKLYDEMLEQGIGADRITFMALVSATTAAGKWDLAQNFLDIMKVTHQQPFLTY